MKYTTPLRITGLVTTALLVVAAPLHAEPTLELRVSGPKEVFQGDPVSSSVDARGEITMGLVRATVADLPEHPVVTMLSAGEKLYVGTSAGGVVQLDGKNRKTTLLEGAKHVVSALAMFKGKLHAATSPDGRIVEVTGKGAGKPFADPEEKYVWAMVEDGKSNLLVATGEPGRVLSVTPSGKRTVVFEPEESHVRALLRHPKRGLIAGGGQKGIVYQLNGKKAFALYDSAYEEVTALAADPKSGDLFAAFVSERKAGAIIPHRTIGPVASDPTDTSSPIKGSEVVRISASGRVDPLWSSKTEGALGLVFDPSTQRLYIGTGAAHRSRGRIYAVDTAQRDRLSLVARVDPSVVSALVLDQKTAGLLAGTAPVGRVVRFGKGFTAQSVYTSVEQDLHRSSRLGRVWFEADVPSGASVAVSMRTGNTRKQDATWSGWSKAVTKPEGGPVKLPEARYAQFKVQMRASPSGASPRIKSLHASVVRMNLPPAVTEVFVLERGVYLRPMPAEAEQEKTITVSNSAIDRLRSGRAPNRPKIRARQGRSPGWMTLTWSALDPNGDPLLFRAEVQSLDNKDGWRLLANDLEPHFHSLDSRAYPDGRYQARVTASDRPGNAPDQALTDAYLSEPFIIDNTPPKVTQLNAAGGADKTVTIKAAAADATSALGSAKVSINGGPWLDLPTTDGLLDARSETFRVTIRADGRPGAARMVAGRNTVNVRVEDLHGNSATRATSFTLR